MSRRINELSDIELVSTGALDTYVRKLNRLFKDLTAELAYSSEELLENLAAIPGSVPGMGSRTRARRVASPLVKAQEACTYAGGQAVRCGVLLRKHFVDDVDGDGMARKPTRKPFELDA